MWHAQDVSAATEYRIGTYIYNDRSLFNRGVCEWEDCALNLLVTVVSVPSDDRAVVDAGSKVLTSDFLVMEGHEHALGRPDIRVAGLSEEHGVLRAENIGLNVGDRLRIIPNHACVVSNMLDDVHLIVVPLRSVLPPLSRAERCGDGRVGKPPPEYRDDPA